MTRPTPAWLLIPLLLLSSPVLAQDPAAQAAQRPELANFVSDETLAMIRLDLNKLDVAAWYQAFFQAAGQPEMKIPQEEDNVRAVQALRDAKAAAIYFLFDMTDLGLGQQPSYVAVPLPPGADADRIRTVIAQRLNLAEARVIRGAVVGGQKKRLDRLQAEEPSICERFATTLAATEGAAIQVVLAPADIHRRAIEEVVMPRLPAELGGGPSTVLTRGAVWASLAVEGPPQLSLRAVVQSQDAPHAQALKRWLDQTVISRLKKDPQLQQLLPNWGQVVEMLRPRVQEDRLVLNLEPGRLSPLVSQLIGNIAKQKILPGEETKTSHNLKILALHMHNFHDVHGTFPAPATFDDQGRPLLSWRVQLLPFLDQAQLYSRFRQYEPWDSEHNRKLIVQMPSVFRSPTSKLPPDSGKTSYLLPILPGGVFEKSKGSGIAEITDGSSSTLMILEGDDDSAVIWTKPEDWNVDPDDPLASLAGQYPDRFFGATCDGAVRAFRLELDKDTLRRFLLRGDGRPLDVGKLEAPPSTR